MTKYFQSGKVFFSRSMTLSSEDGSLHCIYKTENGLYNNRRFKKKLHIIYLIFMCVNNRYVQSVLHKKIIINYKKMLHYLFPP